MNTCNISYKIPIGTIAVFQDQNVPRAETGSPSKGQLRKNVRVVEKECTGKSHLNEIAVFRSTVLPAFWRVALHSVMVKFEGSRSNAGIPSLHFRSYPLPTSIVFSF